MSELRELLVLPERVRKRDYVTVLTEAIDQPEAALADYAVTEDLQRAFGRSLELAQGALRDGRSSAAYIHGSFGTGKSHFMAILSLMMGGHPAPWKVPELHGVLADHGWVRERRLLRLHFHMIGAKSIEEKVFGEYLDFVAREHPDAEVPALFEDAELFENAAGLRETLGDEAFFAKLDETEPAQASGWGKMARRWTADSFDAARASAEPKERAKLFSALVKSFFGAFAKGRSGFVAFDAGLGRLSRHAAGLGYEGVVLFLDELILWLASRAADKAWLNSEAQKVAKLVEAQDERRDAPIVSYVARQRDIAELVGEDLGGSDAANLRDSLKWWEGRFDTVTLPDRNLPAIVEKKVIRPRDEAAKARLVGSFEDARRSLGKSWATLLGDSGDEVGFRRVYPFTPALVEALIALSHFLQRERTALKVLMELLVDHLDDFTLGRVVPIGDLYDALAGGGEPMDGSMRDRFAAARRLYDDELLPVIRKRHGTGHAGQCQRMRAEHPPWIGCSNCANKACRTDNRLVKTLMLAGLVPSVPVLKELTASRLVQLNHGTVTSIVPGREAQDAVERLRTYATEVGALRVGEVGDPPVAVAVGVPPLKPILGGGAVYDNPGARRAKLRELLFAALELQTDQTELRHAVQWRGTTRRGTVLFGNVRQMADDRLEAPPDEDFRVVIDFPFDEPLHGPHEDEARLLSYREAGGASPTVVWLPSFFGEEVVKDLAQLVVIDGILRSPAEHLGGLRPEDQREVRIALDSLRSQKRQHVLKATGAAYGVTRAAAGDLDESRSLEVHFHALLPGVSFHGMPVANVADALEATVDQLLHQRFPRHPKFEDKITRGKLEKALARFEQICGSEGRRQAFDKADRKELHAPEKLGFLEVNPAVVSVRTSALEAIKRELTRSDIEPPTVAQVVAAYDSEGLMGLTREVEDFVALAWAAYGQRELRHDGVAIDAPPLGKVPRDAELVKPPLPSAEHWSAAIERAGEAFGLTARRMALNPGNLRKLVATLETKHREATAARAHEIAELLHRRHELFVDEKARLATAAKAAELLELLAERDPVALIEALAGFQPATSAKALQRHLRDAKATAAALEDELTFQVFGALVGHADERAAGVLDGVRAALEADQLAVNLAPALKKLALEAQRIVRPTPPPRPAGREVVARGAVSGSSIEVVEEQLASIETALREAGDTAELSFHWEVSKQEGSSD